MTRVNSCRFCGHCRIVDKVNMLGICTEEHGPRNVRGELGRQVSLLGLCQHFVLHANLEDRQRRRNNKERLIEAQRDAILE